MRWLILLTSLFYLFNSYAQDSELYNNTLLDEVNANRYDIVKQNNSLDANENEDDYVDENIFREQLKIISPSQKIFIITNSQGKLNPGDFFSILLNNRLVARALVAKEKAGLLGIKIMKIYSLARWSLLKRDMILEILVGDDTHYINRKWEEEKREEEEETQPQDNLPTIDGEEDLYNEELLLEGDITGEQQAKGAIVNDNIVSANYGLYREIDLDNQTVSYEYRAINWAYQFQKDIWAEAEYGQTELEQFPETRISTVINAFTLRLKYSFKLPLYSYAFPYVGYRIIQASSPSAGDTTTGITNEDAANELALLDIVEEDTFIVGVTILRRLVPGWFFRLNLGTDNLSLGFALEF